MIDVAARVEHGDANPFPLALLPEIGDAEERDAPIHNFAERGRDGLHFERRQSKDRFHAIPTYR